MTDKDKAEQVGEPKHPGWQKLSGVFGTEDPFFEDLFFLQGYAFSSNIYAIEGEYPTIVDPGNDYTAFMDLFKLGFKPADIRKIVVTHGHRDHAMGTFELLRSYQDLAGKGGFELILHEAGPREYKELAGRLGVRVTEVRGGETLELGGHEWEVIHSPGHTIDGICLYNAPSRTAFTGDTVLPCAMAEPDELAGGRLDHYLYGIRILLRIDIENVLPGHGLPVASVGKKVIEETYEGLMMKVIGVEAESRTSWIDGAMRLAGAGFLEEALYCCERELVLHPEDPRTLRLKVLSLNDLGRFGEALEAVERIENLPSVEGRGLFARICKGYALMGLGKYDESIPCFDEALRLKPGMKDAQIYKGMALYLSGRQEEALDIEPFRTEFAGRFKEEVLKKTAQGHYPQGCKGGREARSRDTTDETVKKEDTEGQHWTQPAYVDPGIGDKPPAGAWIDKDPVCRNCMTVSEEVTMRRGFIDPISAGEAEEKGYTCIRCGNGLTAL